MATYADLEAEINAQIAYLQTYKNSTLTQLDAWEAELITKQNSVIATANSKETLMNDEADILIGEIQTQITTIRNLKNSFETEVNRLTTDLNAAYTSTVNAINTKKDDAINRIDLEAQADINYLLVRKNEFSNEIDTLTTDLQTALTNAKASIVLTKDSANTNITNKSNETIEEIQDQIDYLQSRELLMMSQIDEATNQGIADIQAKINSSLTTMNQLVTESQTVLNNAKYSDTLIQGAIDEANSAANHAKKQGDYLSTAVNNAKLLADSGKITYKGTVPTYAQIPFYHGSPQIGDTVIVEENNARYRYSLQGTWDFIGNVAESGMVVASEEPSNKGYIWIDLND